MMFKLYRKKELELIKEYSEGYCLANRSVKSLTPLLKLKIINKTTFEFVKYILSDV